MRFPLLRFFKTFQNYLVNARYLHKCDLSVKITQVVQFFFHYCELPTSLIALSTNLYDVFYTICRSYTGCTKANLDTLNGSCDKDFHVFIISITVL